MVMKRRKLRDAGGKSNNVVRDQDEQLTADTAAKGVTQQNGGRVKISVSGAESPSIPAESDGDANGGEISRNGVKKLRCDESRKQKQQQQQPIHIAAGPTQEGAGPAPALMPKPKVHVVLCSASLRLAPQKWKGEARRLVCFDDVVVDNSSVTSGKANAEGKDWQLQESSARPDILHQCLMALLDSPLNKSDCLRIFITVADPGNEGNEKLIRVNPSFRVPRTWKVFHKVMVSFLTDDQGKLIPEGGDTPDPVLEFLPLSVERYLPPSGVKIGLSVKGPLVRLRRMLRDELTNSPEMGETESPTFFIGAVAEGSPVKLVSGITKVVSISLFPLSSAACCTRICCEAEHNLSIF